MIMLYDILLLASEQLLSILIFHFIIFIFILFDDRMDAQYEGLVLEHGDDADAKTNVRYLMMIVMIMMMMMMTIIIVVTIVVIIIVIYDEDRDNSR